jgi:AsmA protein
LFEAGMKIWFKRVLIGLVAALIVAIVGLAIFLLTFDPNLYKSKLADLVYTKYHRTLSVNGDIQLSLFPRIGLSLKDVALSDRDSKTTFASVDSARFAVAIWPLLSNRFVVDHVSVSGLKAWVVRDKNGVFNFNDLIQGVADAAPVLPSAEPEAGSVISVPSAPTPQSVARADLQIDIAGLDLKGGEIHYRDERSGYSARLVKLQANTGRMTFDQPFDVSVRGNLVTDESAGNAVVEGQALIKLDSAQRAYSAQKLNLQVTGQVGVLNAKAATLKGNLAYTAATRLLNASNLELHVQGDVGGAQPVKGLDLSLVVPKVLMNPSRAELNIEKLALRAKGGLPSESFELALDAPRLSVSPEGAKGDTVAGSVKLSGKGVMGFSLSASGLSGNADNLALKELKVEGGIKQDNRMVRVNLSSPVQWDLVKKQGTLSAIKGDVKIEGQAVPAASFEFPLIGSARADLVKDEFSGEINAVLNGSPLNFNVKGSRLANPAIQFNLQAEALDIDKLFPAVLPVKAQAKPEAKPEAAPEAGADAKPGTKAAPPAAKPAGSESKAAQPPAKAAGGAAPKAVANATAAAAAKPGAGDAAKAAPKTAATPAAAQPANAAAAEAGPDIDLSVLDTLDITGGIKVGTIKGRGLEAKNLNVSVRALKGKLDLSKITADLYDGKLSGRITADSHNALTSQLALDGVSVGPLFKGLSGSERVSGAGALKLNLTTQGNTIQALKTGLGGTAQVQIRNGAIQGIDIEHTLAQVGGLLHNLLAESVPSLSNGFDLGSQTAFSSLDANMAIDHGLGQIKKLDVNSPSLRIVQGSPAQVDFINNKLDLVANVRAVGGAKSQLADLRGVTVPVRISGPFGALGYQVQWKDISGALAKKALQNGLLDLLSGKAGAAGETVPERKADTVKSLGNALKGLLGK